VAFLVVHLFQDTRRTSVSITRIGSTKKYADNWQAAFGGRKKSGTKKRSTSKKAATAKRKTAPKKKAAKR
jgi:hypothetical protein